MALKEDMTRITINIKKGENERLKELAEADNRSVSSYVRNLVLREIEQSKKWEITRRLLANE